MSAAAKAAEKIKEIADGFGFSIDPNKKVYDMSVGEKQTVEIIRYYTEVPHTYSGRAYGSSDPSRNRKAV